MSTAVSRTAAVVSVNQGSYVAPFKPVEVNAGGDVTNNPSPIWTPQLVVSSLFIHPDTHTQTGTHMLSRELSAKMQRDTGMRTDGGWVGGGVFN